jgi:hypothetical protein
LRFHPLPGKPFHYDGDTWTDLPADADLVRTISGVGPGHVFLGCAGGFLHRTGM